MRLPAALIPLRNGTFRHLWIASVIGWLGTWLQNTGAGWLMTSLAPEPLVVAMVQAATIMPVFLLALPGGALADIVDRRIFLLGTQVWTITAASVLAILTVCHLMTAGWLLVLTFAIGIGSALTNPAWSAIVPELVPREDMVQAIALNGIGFNLTRAIGPAIAGFSDPAGWIEPCLLDVCDVDPGGDQRFVRLAAGAPVHRFAQGAPVFRDAGWHALRSQYPRDPGSHGSHRRLFNSGSRTLGVVAAVRSP